MPYSIWRSDDLANDRYVGAPRAIYFVNLLGFLTAAKVIGGFAVIGHIQGGRYFLKAWPYGQLTEVSRSVFVYSSAHLAMTAVLTLALFAFEAVRRRTPRRSSAGGLKPPPKP